MATATPSQTYTKEIAPALQKELGKKNVFEVPRVEKVKVSIGMGKIARKGGSSNSMDEAKIKVMAENIAAITGQKPVIHKSKKAVSNFKIRAGMDIGMSVTLRGERAHDFLSRLVNVSLPRVRDFRGIPSKFDGNGNYTVGLRDHTVFPEIQPDHTDFTHGLEVTVVTTAKNDIDGKALLTKLGFPFIKKESTQS